MELRQCPFCHGDTVTQGNELWCRSCNFQIWPVKENDLSLSARDVKQQWDSKAAGKPMLVDVRRLDEYALTNIAGAVFIPMDEFPHRFDDLPTDRHIVTYCHHGVRGAFAARLLRQRGFANVHTMEGGIDAWAELDPSVLKY